MSVLIETYRGWNIYFNPEAEEFHTDSDKYDKEAKKRSYASVKKFIDEEIQSLQSKLVKKPVSEKQHELAELFNCKKKMSNGKNKYC